jgi:hypothetical protein
MMSVKRRLFTILSTALFLALVTLCLRSYASPDSDYLSRADMGGHCLCTFRQGDVCVFSRRQSYLEWRARVWPLCVVTAILPATWLWRWRRDRRLRSDGMPHCAKCDYNLTGNVSGICPECGTPIPADLVRRSMA